MPPGPVTITMTESFADQSQYDQAMIEAIDRFNELERRGNQSYATFQRNLLQCGIIQIDIQVNDTQTQVTTQETTHDQTHDQTQVNHRLFWEGSIQVSNAMQSTHENSTISFARHENWMPSNATVYLLSNRKKTMILKANEMTDRNCFICKLQSSSSDNEKQLII